MKNNEKYSENTINSNIQNVSSSSTSKSPKVKVCEICQRAEFLSEEIIKQTLADHKCIEKYAYILHDKDIDENGKLQVR